MKGDVNNHYRQVSKTPKVKHKADWGGIATEQTLLVTGMHEIFQKAQIYVIHLYGLPHHTVYF